MASLGHVAVGMLIGRLHGGSAARPPGRRPWNALAVFGGLALAPDLDVLLVAMGLSDDGPFGHRGATHSVAAAFVGGAIIAVLFARRGWPLGRTLLASVAAIGSHAFLDILDGARGLALLWPFSEARYRGPWPLLHEAPRGLELFCRAGVDCFLKEGLLFAPLFLLALWPSRARERTDQGLVADRPPPPAASAG